jgi:hypothetical protein
VLFIVERYQSGAPVEFGGAQFARAAAQQAAADVVGNGGWWQRVVNVVTGSQ